MKKNEKMIKADFGKMQQVYGAIKRLDNIDITKDPVDVIEQTMCCIKDLDQNDFSDSMKINFISNVRDGLLEIYQTMSKQINEEIIKPKETVMRGTVINYDNNGTESGTV